MDNPELLILVCLLFVVFVSGLIQGALGFGYAIAALTTLPFLLATQSAHVVISLSGIPVMAMAAWTSRDGADWPTIWRALIGSAIALPIGLLTFGWLSADALTRGTGIAILVLMLAEVFKRGAPQTQADSFGSAYLAGSVSGFLAGAVSIGGPPIVAYALKQSWSALKAKAFITRCLLLTSILKGIGLFAGDFVTIALGWQAFLAMPVAVAGVWLGAVNSRSLPTVQYRRIVAIILILVSCWWIYRGKPTADHSSKPSIEQTNEPLKATGPGPTPPDIVPGQ